MHNGSTTGIQSQMQQLQQVDATRYAVSNHNRNINLRVMIQPINDGGPAFPTATLAQKTEGGMTLRDYFAAAALQALVTSAIELDHVKWDAAAQHAYLCADAMLKAREAK